MDKDRYLQALQADGDLLRDAADGHLDATVPPCPGWTVADVLRHTAEVYEHKMAAIEAGGDKPDPWPPKWPADRDPLEWYADAHRRLVATLTETDPKAPSWTWWDDDQTAGFWVRRMAQETAVHRVDAQSATDSVTPVDGDLAVDGVDEVLTMMLAGDWSDEPQAGSEGAVSVSAGPRRFLVTLTEDAVSVEEGGGPGDASVSGGPSAVLLWLWGRGADDTVDIEGKREVAGLLRERLKQATQ